MHRAVLTGPPAQHFLPESQRKFLSPHTLASEEQWIWILEFSLLFILQSGITHTSLAVTPGLSQEAGHSHGLLQASSVNA